MVLLTMLLADASAKAAEVHGGMSLISSELITAIFTGMAAVLGVVWQKGRNRAKLAEKDEEIKRIKAEIPQPLSIEQSAFQAKVKENEHDHENIFGRLTRLEEKEASTAAKVEATFTAIQRQLDSMQGMVVQLFDRICKGKK